MVAKALLTVIALTPCAYGATLKGRAPNPYVMNAAAVSWHPSCNDANPNNKQETKADAVTRAWAGALELAADGRDRFGKTEAALTKSTPPSGATKIMLNRPNADPA